MPRIPVNPESIRSHQEVNAPEPETRNGDRGPATGTGQGEKSEAVARTPARAGPSEFRRRGRKGPSEAVAVNPASTFQPAPTAEEQAEHDAILELLVSQVPEHQRAAQRELYKTKSIGLLRNVPREDSPFDSDPMKSPLPPISDPALTRDRGRRSLPVNPESQAAPSDPDAASRGHNATDRDKSQGQN